MPCYRETSDFNSFSFSKALVLFLMLFCIESHALPLECRDLLKDGVDYGAEFIRLLESGEYKLAHEILLEEEAKVVQRVHSTRSSIGLKSHWAATFTGRAIQTPLRALKMISDELEFEPGETLIDLGSGHGDPALVF